MRSLLLGIAGIALLMVVWEAVVRIFFIPNYILPSMSAILVATATEWRALVAAAAMTVFEVIGCCWAPTMDWVASPAPKARASAAPRSRVRFMEDSR